MEEDMAEDMEDMEAMEVDTEVMEDTEVTNLVSNGNTLYSISETSNLHKGFH